MDKEDFDFRIELAKLQTEIGMINSASISMLGAAVGATIATMSLGGITNFNQHPVEFASLFGMIGLLFAVGGLLFLSSSKRFEIRTRVLEEKYTKRETTQDKPSTSAAT
jgi:hypothetical protein